MAFQLAQLEGDYYVNTGDFDSAADRFYFALRISDIQDSPVKVAPEMLRKLGDLYLFLKSYENAFETRVEECAEKQKEDIACRYCSGNYSCFTDIR